MAGDDQDGGHQRRAIRGLSAEDLDDKCETSPDQAAETIWPGRLGRNAAASGSRDREACILMIANSSLIELCQG